MTEFLITPIKKCNSEQSLHWFDLCYFLMNNKFPHLTHEIWYDPVEDGVLQPKAVLASAESPEVLCSLGNNVGEKLYGDGAQWLVISRHFEEHLWVSLSGVFLDSGHLWRQDT